MNSAATFPTGAVSGPAAGLPEPGGAPALSVEHASHRFGPRLALDDVSFAIAPGSFTALLGLNGAGKSTLFSLVTRLYAIQAGTIRVFGHDLQRDPGEALRLLGVVFQPRTLDLELTVNQNLVYHAALHGIGKRKALVQAAEVLAHVQLAERAKDKVKVLSGGQMRRVEIARALLHGPRLLLLDEPTVGLDVRSRAEILGHVRRLVAEQGITALWATHLFDEIGPGDGLVVLHEGKVLAAGQAAGVIAATGTADIQGAFMRLTDLQKTEEGGP